MHTYRLTDTALLERRLWITQLAQDRHCSLTVAEIYDTDTRHWYAVATLVGYGILFTLCLML